MKLQDFKHQVHLPLPVCTLVLLIEEGQVWLGLKKRGFGMGWWNGFGGKRKPTETVRQAAVRETLEESGVIIRQQHLQPVATIDFYFPHDPKDKQNNQRVQVFICDRWIGEPCESEEMAPRRFAITDLPLDAMWPGDNLWLPRILAGQTGTVEIMFNPLDDLMPVAESHINLL